MSSDKSQRAALLALLGRKLAGEQAVKTVLFQQAIADRLGLNTTDLMCLSFLSDTEPLTAGQLAEATGLTTGSVTVMIDRLEKAGYVQRERDPTDRRRVIVRPLTERIERDIAPLYASIGERMGASDRALQHARAGGYPRHADAQRCAAAGADRRLATRRNGERSARRQATRRGKLYPRRAYRAAWPAGAACPTRAAASSSTAPPM